MRKQLLGLLVPLMAFVLIASAADTTGKGAITGAALQKLEVAHSQDGLRVEFKAKKNRRGLPGGFGFGVRLAYAPASPSAERCENAK